MREKCILHSQKSKYVRHFIGNNHAGSTSILTRVLNQLIHSQGSWTVQDDISILSTYIHPYSVHSAYRAELSKQTPNDLKIHPLSGTARRMILEVTLVETMIANLLTWHFLPDPLVTLVTRPTNGAYYQGMTINGPSRLAASRPLESFPASWSLMLFEQWMTPESAHQQSQKLIGFRTCAPWGDPGANAKW